MPTQQKNFSILFDKLEELTDEKESQITIGNKENVNIGQEEYEEIRVLGEIVREIEFPQQTFFAST